MRGTPFEIEYLLQPHPTQPCTLRPMEVDDLPRVMQIERNSYEFPWTEGNFRDCLNAGYQCLLAIGENDVMGYGVLMLAAQEGHILNICITPEQRGNQFSRVLLDHMINLCIREQAQEVFLEVRPSNQIAIRLYESLGFNEVGIRPNYYNTVSGREDALIYVKSL